MSETAAVAPAPVAAPSAEAPATATTSTPTEAQRPSFAEVKAKILGAEPVAPQGQAPADVTPDETTWLEQALPKPKPQSLAERLALKAQREEAAKQSQTYEAKLREMEAQTQTLVSQQQRADAEFQRLIDANDVEGALKIKGVSLPFQELQRRELIRRGALEGGGKDPRVDAMAKELESLKQERAQALQRQQQAQLRAQQQREQQEYERIVTEELSTLKVPRAQEFAKSAGVSQAVLQVMMQDRSLTTEQAAAIVYRDYQALYEQLNGVFGKQQAPAPQQQPPAQSLRERITAPRAAVPTGAAPATGVPPELKGREKFEWIKARIARGELGS